MKHLCAAIVSGMLMACGGRLESQDIPLSGAILLGQEFTVPIHPSFQSAKGGETGVCLFGVESAPNGTPADRFMEEKSSGVWFDMELIVWGEDGRSFDMPRMQNYGHPSQKLCWVTNSKEFPRKVTRLTIRSPQPVSASSARIHRLYPG